MDDFVSLCIYSCNEKFQDLHFFIKTDKYGFSFPIGKIPLEKTASTSNKCFQVNRNHSPDKTGFDGNLKLKMAWNTAAEHLWNSVKGNVSKRGNLTLLDLLRVFSVQDQQYYYHATFMAQLDCQDMEKLNTDYGVIVSFKHLRRSKFRRQRMMYLAYTIYKATLGDPSRPSCESFKSISGGFYEEIAPQTVFSEQDKQFNIIRPSVLFDAAEYSENERLTLYEEFIRSSFPHRTISLVEAKTLLSMLGYTGREEQLFRAFDENKSCELNVYQFMFGIAAMDPVMKHGEKSGEYRSRLIFRYYDNDGDGFLDRDDMNRMVKDIASSQNIDMSLQALEEAVENAFQSFDLDSSQKISLAHYLACLGTLRFRGTSLLFRAPHRVSGIIQKKWDQLKKGSSSPRDMKNRPTNASHPIMNGFGESVEDFSPGACSWGSNYSLAEHAVKVRRSGTVSSTANLLDMEKAGDVCNTGLETLVEDQESNPVGHPGLISKEQKLRVKKQVSAQAFNTKSIPNEVLAALRYFEHPSPDSSKFPKGAFEWGIVSREKLVKHIITICDSVKTLLENESRLIRVSSPCYILGDLHGNFHDLICFEKALWRLGPHLTPANFLFLGDYVDRGEYGVEVVIYLLAQKLKAPGTFHLLRGNHELREVQKYFSFHKECLEKFGKEMGPVVWEVLNTVFDRMPIAAVIDEKIFCIHGGIPNLEGPLEIINDIPCPLSRPEDESHLAWQMMWNDPMDRSSADDQTKQELEQNRGFADNQKRQTGFVFDETAFDRFLLEHELTHVVRAHEVKQAGFQIQQRGRLLTVFSSSQYCGMNNESACILIHNHRIRVIRLDTT